MGDNDKQTAIVERAQEAGTALAQSSDLDVARALVASGFFPSIKTASQALVKIQAGRELGFGPVASMTGIHVIETKGRVSVQLSANMVANLVRRSTIYDFRVRTLTEEECRIEFYRKDALIGESHFTLADAKRAGLADREIWKAHPRNMLFNAAIRNGAKWFCSEVLLGAPMPVSDTGSEEDVDTESGEVIEARPVKVVREPPEGYKPNWNEFWATVKEIGMTREQVHAYYELPPTPGAFKEYADGRADREGKPMSQMVPELLAEIGLAVETGLIDREAVQEPLPEKA